MKKWLALGLLLLPLVSLSDIRRPNDTQYLSPDAKNLLKNPGAESGLSGWTASGSSVLARDTDSADIGRGDTSFNWDATAASETLKSDSVSIPAGLYGRNCMAQLLYKGGGTADIDIKVTDGTNTLSSFTVSSAASGFQKVEDLTFICPSSGSLEIELEAQGNADAIIIDDIYLGENFRVVSVENKGGSFSANHDSTCGWSIAGSSYADFSDDGSCVFTQDQDNDFGTVSSLGSNQPGIVFTPNKTGRIRVCATVTAQNNGDRASFQLIDQDSNVMDQSNWRDAGGSTQEWSDKLCGVLEVSDLSSHTVKIQGKKSAGTTTVLAATSDRAVSWDGFYVPPHDEVDVIVVDSGWYVDVNIGGANIGLGGSAQSSYVAPSNSGLDLVVNSGSQDAQISCTSTNESDGLTCSAGDEQPGISFTIPRSGSYEVCADFNHVVTANADSANVAFQLVNTPNNAQTITLEGNARMQSFQKQDGANDDGIARPIHLCGIFPFSDSGKKTVRLMYEQGANTVSTNQINADRSATTGQRDIRFTVKPVTQNIPMPVVVGGISSNSTGAERLERMAFGAATEGLNCTSSPCTIYRQSGSWVSSVTRNSLGNYTINIAAGIFSGVPVCTMTPKRGDRNVTMNDAANTSTAVTVQCDGETTNTADDCSLEVICMGPR